MTTHAAWRVLLDGQPVPVPQPVVTACESCAAGGRLRPEDAPTLTAVPVRVGTAPSAPPTNTTDGTAWRYGTVPAQWIEHVWLCPRCLAEALGSFLTYLEDRQRRRWLAAVRGGQPAAASLLGRDGPGGG